MKQALAYPVIKEDEEYVTFRVDRQIFGIPVERVQDVLRRQRLTRIPLAPKEIMGTVNLRGRIVTVINMRQKLDLPTPEHSENNMNIVIEHRGELFSLWVDSVGDVLSLPRRQRENTPANIALHWQEFLCGVYPLKEELLLIVSVEALLGI